jgi:hypothetical protein
VEDVDLVQEERREDGSGEDIEIQYGFEKEISSVRRL